MSTSAFRGILSRPHPQLYSGIFCRGHGVDGLSWAWSGLSVAADDPLHVAHSRPLLFEVAEAFFVSSLELSAPRQAVFCLLQEELDEKCQNCTCPTPLITFRIQAYQNEVYLLPKALDETVAEWHIPHSVQSSPSLLGNAQFLEVSRLTVLLAMTRQHRSLDPQTTRLARVRT